MEVYTKQLFDSGCVTSAESVLITMQSQEELYKVLNANKLALEHNDPSQYRTVVISLSPQSRASLAAKYNLSPLQCHRRLVAFFKHHLGVHHVFDTSFSRDLSLVEAAREFVERYRRQGGGASSQELSGRRRKDPDGGAVLPMLASACPGWVCYAEKTHAAVLPFISTAKSPQQMMGSLVKDYWANLKGLG